MPIEQRMVGYRAAPWFVDVSWRPEMAGHELTIGRRLDGVAEIITDVTFTECSRHGTVSSRTPFFFSHDGEA